MDLKKLFDGHESLTLAEFESILDEKGIKLADLSEGGYVSKSKYDDAIEAKDKQIEALNGTISTRDTDLEALKKQLEEAGADSSKLAELTNNFTALQDKYDNDTKSYKEQLSKQKYEFAVKEFANSKKFSSAAAKRDFVSTMISKELKLDGDTILGADDFVKAYTADNSDAFVAESNSTPEASKKPEFVGSTTNNTTQTPTNENPFGFNFIGVRKHE